MTYNRPLTNSQLATYLNEVSADYENADDIRPVALASSLALPPGWRPKETPKAPAPAPATRRALLYSDVEADEFAEISAMSAMSCCDGY